jgi:hypothetical protein
MRFATGYQERVYKAAELAGRKVKRSISTGEQSSEQIASALKAWVAATRRPG